MPELRLPEVHLPELRLPEMSRDDISRVFEEKTRDIDLSRLDPRKADLSGLNEISKELSKVDLPKAIAQATGKQRRSRWPFVAIGAAILGLMAIAVASSPRIRPKLEQAADATKRRIDEVRANRALRDQEAHAFDAAVAVPVEPSAFADDAPTTGSPYDGSAGLPEGFGATTADLSPTAAEAARN